MPLVRLSMQADRLAQQAHSEESGALAARLAVEVDEAASTLRSMVHGVMPARLVERGLAAAVQELGYDLPVRTTLQGVRRAQLPQAGIEHRRVLAVLRYLTR